MILAKREESDFLCACGGEGKIPWWGAFEKFLGQNLTKRKLGQNLTKRKLGQNSTKRKIEF